LGGAILDGRTQQATHQEITKDRSVLGDQLLLLLLFHDDDDTYSSASWSLSSPSRSRKKFAETSTRKARVLVLDFLSPGMARVLNAKGSTQKMDVSLGNNQY
jgi:hypothetical protein